MVCHNQLFSNDIINKCKKSLDDTFYSIINVFEYFSVLFLVGKRLKVRCEKIMNFSSESLKMFTKRGKKGAQWNVKGDNSMSDSLESE